MENKTQQTDNARLRVWIGGDCPRCDGPVGFVANGLAWCSAECADRAGDFCYDDATESIPKFYEESGFFALLSGLRAKGFSIVLQFSQGIGRWEACVIIDGRRVFGHHDTPELALFQAAIKAMTSEEKAD